MADLDTTFAALASGTRRAILADLLAGPATVKRLAGPRKMTLPAVSQHLKVLEAAGLVSREVRGREHHIRLEAEAMARAWRWIDEHRTFWERQLDSLEAFPAQEHPIDDASAHEAAEKP